MQRGDFFEKIKKLGEGKIFVRVLDKTDGKTSWGLLQNGAAAENGVELLDGDMLPAGRRKAGDLLFKTPLDPTKIWCVGLNYREHAKESKMELPPEPLIFMKPNTCLIADGEAVKIPNPDELGRVDYEGELAVVMGRNCRNVSEGDALNYVLGYSCFNDVSARVLQKKDGQWIRAKGFDTFGPFGPALLLRKAMPPEARMRTKLNGAVVQDTSFSDMIFSVPSIISHISRFATLEAGDIIATGTPSGVGRVAPGDVVEIEIGGIGTLKNPVEAEIFHA